MSAVIAMIVLAFVGIFLKHYMASNGNAQDGLLLGEKIKVSSWIIVVMAVFLLMILAMLFFSKFEENERVRIGIPIVALALIWIPVVGLIRYSTLYVLLTDKYLEKGSIFGKKYYQYEEIAKVESLPQGMYTLHLKSGKKVVFEPVFKQSPKIKSYLQDIAYENRSRERRKHESRG